MARAHYATFPPPCVSGQLEAGSRYAITRLEQIFSSVRIEPSTKDNDILDELMSAAKDSVSNIGASPLRDAAPIVNGN
jgi:hypothetical protein